MSACLDLKSYPDAAASALPILDFEASGLKSGSYPIEVAVRLADGATLHSLIRPMVGWQDWDYGAEALHGISRRQLVREGSAPAYVCTMLNNFCRDMTIYSDCWCFDNQWLHKLYGSVGMMPTFRLMALEYVLDDEQIERLHLRKAAVARRMGLKAHRALNDVNVIHTALQSVQQEQASRTLL